MDKGIDFFCHNFKFSNPFVCATFIILNKAYLSNRINRLKCQRELGVWSSAQNPKNLGIKSNLKIGF